MNKKILITTLLLITLLLSACGSAAATTGADTTAAATPASAQIPRSTELLVGTLSLDGTGQQVTPEQAAELLPLWKLLKSLSASDTAAQAEIDSLAGQIESAMTGEQLAAIQAMQLTSESTFTLMQDLGVTSGAQDGSAAGSGAGVSGTPPEGGMGPGAGAGPGSGEEAASMSPEQIATAQAARAERMGGGTGIPTALLDALIAYLEEIAQA